MLFEQTRVRKFGKIIGYSFSYFLFTTILFYILTLTTKLPTSWTYVHIMGVTISISLIGIGIKRILR